MNDWKPNEKVTQWRRLAEYWGRQTECPAALILAVIEQESGGDKDAVRYEPEYEKRYKARCEEISDEADIAVPCVASSYGLMQLMLPLAWGYMSKEQRDGNVVATLCGIYEQGAERRKRRCDTVRPRAERPFRRGASGRAAQEGACKT